MNNKLLEFKKKPSKTTTKAVLHGKSVSNWLISLFLLSHFHPSHHGFCTFTTPHLLHHPITVSALAPHYSLCPFVTLQSLKLPTSQFPYHHSISFLPSHHSTMFALEASKVGVRSSAGKAHPVAEASRRIVFVLARVYVTPPSGQLVVVGGGFWLMVAG